MNTVKILFIPNVSRFLQVIDRCTGAVLLDLPDVGLCDLKENEVVRGLLKLISKINSGNPLYLILTESRDTPHLMQYMMEAKIS